MTNEFSHYPGCRHNDPDNNDLDNLNRDPWPRVDTIRDINGNIVGEWSLKLKTRRA